MFIIRNHDFAADLYYYAGKKGEPGRYGWGPEDLIDGKASRLVEFELREEAWAWLEKNKNFSRGSVPIPLPGSVTTRGRGRPTTGKAMTPAERKAAQRARDRNKAWDLASTPHKVPPRVIAKVLETPENYGKAAAFTAWLEMGERMGWISPEQRRAMMRANTP